MLSLEYFVVVAEELNITRAAQKLYISQQSLSAYIMKLEKHYRTKLFERKPRFKLTQAGQILYYEAKKLVEQRKDLEKLMESYQSDRESVITLVIGLTVSNDEYLRFFMPVAEYVKKWPNVCFEFCIDKAEVLKEKLRKGEIDVYFLSFREFEKNPK